jgi:nickel-dependent lactate racemase
MRLLSLPYGSGTVTLSLPGDVKILGELSPVNAPGVGSFEEAFRRSLRDPIASKGLGDLCSPGDRVALLVSDVTRSYKTSIFLPWLLDELNSAGVPDEDVFVVFARGAHRPQRREEQLRILGREAADRVAYTDHDCRNEEEHTYLGTSSRGTEVRLNESVVEADRCVLTGLIEYHYYAGFTGGRKSVLPGIASYETIQQNHRLLFEPGAGTGRLQGNPVHEDMLEAAGMLRPDFLINLVLNAEGDVADVFAGDYVEAHLEGCRLVERLYGRRISQRADIVIASSGGYPKDINYYQAHKALDNAFHAVKEGGVIVLLAECREGLGHERFPHWFNYTASEAKERLMEEFEVVGHNAYSTLNKAEKARIILVSSLPRRSSRHLPFRCVGDAQDALEEALDLTGDSPSAYIMPRAYSTFPVTGT